MDLTSDLPKKLWNPETNLHVKATNLIGFLTSAWVVLRATDILVLTVQSGCVSIFMFLEGLGAASAQPVDARPPKFSTAPAVALSNPLRIPLFHFYKFTPIADTKGGFPFQ